MTLVARLIEGICAVNTILGRVFAWFSLGVIVVCFGVVILRYGLRMGSVPMQDLYVWLNGMMFMGIAGYTFMRDGHVRVDIFYGTASLRRKAMVDLFGCIVFVAPFLAVVATWGWPYVWRSWALAEGSANVGGLPGLFVLKSFLLVFVVVVGLQALAMALRSVLVLAGRQDLVPPGYRYSEG